MQRNKGIQNISEINDLVIDDFHVLHSLRRVLERFNMSSITRVFSSIKSKGISANELFKVLFMFPFLSINNVSCLFSSGLHHEIVGKKDTYYRFLNNPNIPWRKVMNSFTNQFFKQAKVYGSCDFDNPTKCLIVDDSIIPKSGKKIEFIGKVFDHCSHLYSLGIKFLLLGYWDGKSFVPMDFSLHFEPGKTGKRGLSTKELNNQYSKDRPEYCCSYKRIEELGLSKIEVALQMIKRAAGRKLPISYVLADSWFVSEKFIKGIVNLKLNMIGLMKSNRMVVIGSKSFKLNKLPELKRSKIVNCKKYKCQYIPLQVTYKDVEIKVFLVRMNGQSTWKTLVTTNTKLSFINTMKLYQIRWSIEVFFKDAKQHLNIQGCQSNDFDAHIAHYSLVCMEFTALSLIKRIEGYETIGNLLLNLKDSLIQQTIIKKIWQLIAKLYNEILIDFGIDLDLFIRKIINDDSWRKRINGFADFLLKGQANQITVTH
jgi:hypothetical protein